MKNHEVISMSIINSHYYCQRTGKRILVHNGLVLRKDTVIDGDLTCGHIVCEGGRWDLTVKGDLDCLDINCQDINCQDINCMDINCQDINCQDITCWDINCDNITCQDITCWNITCMDINCQDINCQDINCQDINCQDITCWDINCDNINCQDILYYAVCYAYNNITCNTIKGKRINSHHFCLDGKITIRKK